MNIETVEIPNQNYRMQECCITFAQYDEYCEATNTDKPEDEGWGRDDRPVINVSYLDIVEGFIPWLNKTTGKSFRLPTEEEWEYCCRAGSTTNYSWGDDCHKGMANYSNDCTVPVKSYPPNAFGLFQMHGNVWEWCNSVWIENE